MRLSIFSALSVLGLGLIGADAVNNVYIDPATDLVCLILPPPGKLIGDTQTIGHVQCTNGKPQLLPSNFFITKQFKTTADYVQAWGIMDPKAVGMLANDGGGQYDIHKDSGINASPGYPVFVELLEPDSGRWCIRFCHKLDKTCNMGKSSAGCEGALGITEWSAAPATASTSNKTTAAVASKAATTTSISHTSTAPSATSAAAPNTTTAADSKNSNSASKTTVGSIASLAMMAGVYALFF
ncbi:hypothetical protein BGZ98_008316 [Dissophora globulifera]|nr:hypothetical protein BGZ98_008316 [Dissophora globulifera]